MERSWWRAVARGVFGVLGFVFLAVTFGKTWDSAQGNVVPGWTAIAVSSLLVLVGLLAAARSWMLLFPAREATWSHLATAFFRGQLGKYIPGGVWQAVGQVALSSGRGIELAQAATAFAVHAVVQLVAALVVGALAGLVAPQLSWPFRLGPALGLCALLLLRRRWFSTVLRWLSSKLPELPGPTTIPARKAIRYCFGWSLVTVLAMGSAFSILIASGGESEHFLTGIPVFAFSWAVGYLALPFPSGVGVREGVMLLYLARSAPAVIGASLIFRLIAIALEGVLAIIPRRSERW